MDRESKVTTPIDPAATPCLDVEEVVAGEFGLVGDEGKARFRLGAHQPTAGPGDQQVNVPTADRARRASQDALPTFL